MSSSDLTYGPLRRSYFSAHRLGRCAFGLLVGCFPFGGMTQSTYDVGVPDHTTCATALPICGDVIYNVNYTGGTGWHYFTFTLEEAIYVDIEITRPFGSVSMTGPCEGEDPICTEGSVSGCTVTPTSTTGPPAPFSTRWTGMLGPGKYFISRYVHPGMMPGSVSIHVFSGLECQPLPCDGCLPSFSPLPGKTYIVNAWTKEEGNELGTLYYEKPRLRVQAPPGTVQLELAPDQNDAVMVEGWQLMEGTFTMPALGGEIILSLASTDGSPVLFDDVRIFPADGSMKSYVYDPLNLRFVAELDERHFATFYEYDNEGRPVRVKKETERGIMTLRESRQSAPHMEP